MKILIVTGMSGAGKTKCLKHLEDLGYLCIDNIMPELIPQIVATCDRNKEAAAIERLAVSADVRGGIFFNGIFGALKELGKRGFSYRTVFLDATDDVLVSRYKETRRDHPLSIGGLASKGIAREREILAPLKLDADIYIDTSHLSLEEFRQRIYDAIGDGRTPAPGVIFLSFGFKRGIPMDCDMVYDMRFLPNPFHEPDLRPKNGTHPAVAAYVFASPAARPYLDGIAAQIQSILPAYLSAVKPCLIVGIGCTGGKHRSVAAAEYLTRKLSADGIAAKAEHRDLFKE